MFDLGSLPPLNWSRHGPRTCPDRSATDGPNANLGRTYAMLRMQPAFRTFAAKAKS